MPYYTLHFNNAEICAGGFESINLSLRAGGPDEVSFVYSRDASGTAPHAYEDAVVLTAKLYNDDDDLLSTTTIFSGYILTGTTRDDGPRSGFVYRAVNAWQDLRDTVLTQSVKSYNPDTETLVDADVSRVLLGMDTDGSQMTTGEIIQDILSNVLSQTGAPTTGTIQPNLTVPNTEVVDTSGDQALRQILRYHPDHVAFMEGANFNVLAPASLTSLAIDPTADNIAITVATRTDKAPPGVVLTFEITHEIDGITRMEQFQQSAGATSGRPAPVRMTIPLAGAQVSYVKEEIQTRTLPDSEDLTTDLAKNFYKGLVPQIQGADLADLAIVGQTIAFADPGIDDINDDGDEVVNPNSKPIDRGSAEVEDFPRMLISGECRPWMDGSPAQWEAIITATVYYKGNDAAVRKFVGSGIEISETITITDAFPKVYKEIDKATLAETPIAGLATSYWNAIKTATEEGSIKGTLDGQWLNLRPGRKFTATGYISNAAPITSFTLDLLTQEFESTFGGSEYLNPKSLTELARALARNRPTYKRPEERTLAQAGIGRKGIRPGAVPVTRFGGPKNGRKTVRPWDIVVTDPEALLVRVERGTILSHLDTVSNALIDGDDEGETYTVASGNTLCIKLASLAATEYNITLETTWPIANDYYVETETGEFSNEVFDYRLFPLWQFTATQADGDIQIGDNLWAIRLAPETHFKVYHTVFQTSQNASMLIPDLLPYHRVVTTS